MRTFRLLLCLGLAWPVLQACADAAGGAEEEPDAGETLPIGDAFVAPDANVIIPPGARELQLIGERDRLVFHSQRADIKVRYVASNMQPIPNAQITMRMYDEQGNDRTAGGHEGSGLRTGNANTNAQGEATFEFIAGERDVTVRLEATAQDADAISANIVVAREGAGGLTVKVNYNAEGGRYSFRDLGTAETTLFSNQNCEVLRGSALNLVGAEFAAEIAPFNEVDNHVTINDLDDMATFSVAAVVRNVSDNIVAFGCQDAVRITGGQVTTVDIIATDLPLEFKGKFTVVNRFDLVDILRSSDNSTLNTVADVLDVLRIVGNANPDGGETRGEALITLFCDLVDIDDGICRILRPIGARLIERAIQEFVPPLVLDVLTVISDVLTIVAEMTTVGEIEFTQPTVDSNGRLEGNDNRWQRFRFRWNNNCPAEERARSGCVREFTVGNLDVNRRPIAGAFGATVEGQELLIDPHGLNFRYGLIILGILETWAFPAIVGAPPGMAVTLEELMQDLLEGVCESINDFLGDPNSGLCEEVLVAALAEVIYDQIGRLDFEPGAFTIQGTALILDEDGDLQVDKLDEGQWVGLIRIDEDTTLSFPGCFTACRDEECPPPACTILPLPEDLPIDEMMMDEMGEP